MDVSIEWTDSYTGIIKFSTDYFMLGEFAPKDAWNVFQMLIRESRECSISSTGGFLVIMLSFDYYDIKPAE